MIGHQLEHFRVVEQIGSGGMGIVYRAHDEKLDRDVALKMLPDGSFQDPICRSRLLREARTTSKLNHPNICTVHEVGEFDGHIFIAMELVEGRALGAILADGPLPPDQVLDYGCQVAAALAHAHDRGIVHRDLKGSNIMITCEGRVKVLDFGLAAHGEPKDLREATTVSRDSVAICDKMAGTLAYMAPERLRGQSATERSDIWSLGVVLYEMGAGERPFQGKTAFEVSSGILNLRPPAPSLGIREARSGRLWRVIERCLEKDPARRFRTAGEVCAILESLQWGRKPRSRFLRRRLPRRRAWVAAAGVAALAAAVMTARGVVSRIAFGRPPLAVAVLPMSGQLSGSEGRLALAAVADAVTTRLSRLDGIQVVAGREVQAVAQEGVRLVEVASVLGVVELVEVAVAQDRPGGSARLTLSRIDGVTGRLRWSEEIEVGTHSLPLLQDRVTQVVTDAYQGYTLDQTMAARPINPIALAAFLEARSRSDEGTTSAGYAEEIALLEKALQQAPDFFEAALLLADYHRYLFETTSEPRHREEAEAFLARADATAPGDPRVVRRRITILQGLGRPGEAEVLARRLTVTRPGDPEVWRALGDALQRLGRLPEAEQSVERACSLRPSWENLFTLADVRSDRGDRAGALAILEDLHSRHPNNTHIRARLAFVLYSAGDVAGAEVHYRALAESSATNTDFNNLGSMLLLLGRFAEAEECFRKSVELAPNRSSHRYNLAKALFWNGDQTGARREFVETLNLVESQLASGVDVVRNRRTRALCLAHLGRGAEAVLEMQWALAGGREDAYTLCAAATVAALVGDRESALAWTTRAREAGALTAWFSGPEFAGLQDDSRFVALMKGHS